MCTISCLQRPAPAYAGAPPVRLRVVFNRDERRTRLPALPPEVITRGARRVLMPRDADAGGTWIAVNDAGVVFALLNLYADGDRRPDQAHGAPPRTRGAVIGCLVEAVTAADALERTHALDPHVFRPFRALAWDRNGSVLEAVSNGETLCRSLDCLEAPFMRTSSSLGDAVVIEARRTLFRTLVEQSALPTAATQDAFHHHCWPRAGELSVRMCRSDARSVSITTVEVLDAGVRMLYRELADVRTRDDAAILPAIAVHPKSPALALTA